MPSDGDNARHMPWRHPVPSRTCPAGAWRNRSAVPLSRVSRMWSASRLSTASLQQHLKMRRTSRNPAKATDRIADIPSGSRSSRPLQDPRLPPTGGPRCVFRRSLCRSHPHQTFLPAARGVPAGTC